VEQQRRSALHPLCEPRRIVLVKSRNNPNPNVRETLELLLENAGAIKESGKSRGFGLI
jgi:hypothetical protein